MSAPVSGASGIHDLSLDSTGPLEGIHFAAALSWAPSHHANPDGDVVCNEGAYSGEVCSRVQNNYYGCIWVSDYTGLSGSRYECNIVWSERLSSPYIGNQAGDSGGPMIRYVNGSLKVTGIVSAGSGVVPCQYNTTTCYQNDFYTAMDQILTGEYPGASLITG